MLLDIAEDTFVSEDIVKLLGPTGINLLLEIMWLAYHNICKKGIKKNYDENRITEEFLVEINEIFPDFKSSFKIKLSAVNQKSDTFKKFPKGQAPTIDFSFRSYYIDDIYFGAECKLFVDGCNTRRKNYVTDGMARYLNRRYSNKSSEASMIGYIVNDSIEDSVTIINNTLEKIPTTLLTRSFDFDDPYYLSKHQREDNSQILLHHLFFNFNNVIR